jgi:chromosome segregation ATPase
VTFVKALTSGLNLGAGHADIPFAGKERGPMTEQEAMAQEVNQEVSAKSVAEHLNALLLSADSTAQRIVREAESRAQEQLAEVDQRVRRMEAEAASLTAWKLETDQMIQTLADAIGDFSKDVAQIPQRIDQALTPLAAHVPVVVRQIEDLRTALGMPASESRPEGHQENGSQAFPQGPEQVGSQVGEIQIGWLPGWEDLEDGTR